MSVNAWGTVADTFYIHDYTNLDRTNIPIHMGRPAKDNEFNGSTSFPQVTLCTDNTYSVCTTTIGTQINVLKSWADQSVAIYSMDFIIDSLAKNATNYYKIQSQSTCNCGIDKALTPTQMLSTSGPNYDFDATIDLYQPYANDHSTDSARTDIFNLFQGTVSSLGTSDTSIAFTVTNGTAPAIPFDLFIWNSGATPYSLERVRVTAVSGTSPNLTLTVVRGFDGTLPISHQNGDHAWNSEFRYVESGPVATAFRLIDPISKAHNMGWTPINSSSFSIRSDPNCATAGYSPTNATCIGSIASTAGWTSNMLARIQYMDQNQNPTANSLQYVYLTPISSSAVSIQVNGPYPANGVACASLTNPATQSGKIWPDQWVDATSNSYKSLTPEYFVRFWPTLKKYQVVYYSGENSDSERAQDLHYDLLLKIGLSSPTTTYYQTNIWHTYGQVWMFDHYNDPSGTNVSTFTAGSQTVTLGKEFWGGDPTASPFFPGITAEGINYNAAYLTNTSVLPNYDTTIVPSESYVAQSYSGSQDDQVGVKAFPGNWLPSGLTATVSSNATVTNGLVSITASNGAYRTSTPAAYLPLRVTIGTGANAERFIIQSGLTGTAWKGYRAQDGTTAKTHTADPISWVNQFSDPAGFDKLMGTGGPSEYSGPNTNWNVTWLDSQDPRMYIKMQGLARIAGAYALNMREGKTQNRYVRGDCNGSLCNTNEGTGLGHWVVGVDRPTFRDEFFFLGSNPNDNIIPVSVANSAYQPSNGQSSCIADSGWDVGYNHIPDAFSFIYSVTANPWYLSRMQAWAAMAYTYNSVESGSGTGQGPNSTYATFPILINNRPTPWFAREWGMNQRSRAYAAFFSNDNSKDQQAASDWLYDGVAAAEGYHNIKSDGSGAFGIHGSFQNDAYYDPGGNGAWGWNYTNYYLPQNYKIDTMLGQYEDGQSNTIYSASSGSGQPGSYGNFPPGRSIYNRLGGINSPNANPNKLFPVHASSVPVFDILTNTDSTPNTVVLTTTSVNILGTSLISAATSNGGNWQITITTTSGLSPGQRVWVECAISNCIDNKAKWSGMGATTILSTDTATKLTLNVTAGTDTYIANSANFFPLSVPLIPGGCAQLIATTPLPKKVYIDTGSNEEMYYVDSCPTNGQNMDVMSAQVSGSASMAAFGPGFGNTYGVFGLGRAYELGLKRVLPLLTYMEHFYVDGITDPTYNPYLFKQGYSSTHSTLQGNPAITTWAQKLQASNPWMQNDTSAELGTAYRYMEYSFMATSYCTNTGLSNCPQAQAWMSSHVQPGLQFISITSSQPAPHNLMKNDVLPRSVEFTSTPFTSFLGGKVKLGGRMYL